MPLPSDRSGATMYTPDASSIPQGRHSCYAALGLSLKYCCRGIAIPVESTRVADCRRTCEGSQAAWFRDADEFFPLPA